jgi:hypothetical protein
MTGPSGRYLDPFFSSSDDYGHLYGHTGQNLSYETMLPTQHIDVRFFSLSAFVLC